MKLTDAEVRIVDGHLVIEGNEIEGLFAEAENEPNILQHAAATTLLPAEDLMPGHVIPAMVYTTSRAT